MMLDKDATLVVSTPLLCIHPRMEHWYVGRALNPEERCFAEYLYFRSVTLCLEEDGIVND